MTNEPNETLVQEWLRWLKQYLESEFGTDKDIEVLANLDRMMKENKLKAGEALPFWITVRRSERGEHD